MISASVLIASARALLLDFDGPVTTLMPAPLNAETAQAARGALEGLELPVEIRDSHDHLAVLRWTVRHAPSRLGDVEEACTAAEVDCASRSLPSPEIQWLLDLADRSDSALAIVSNNSDAAVRTFLDRFSWSCRFSAFACRTLETSRLLKPNPFLVLAAVEFVGVVPGECVFVGDSVSDVQAGKGAGVTTIGLAKTPGRGDPLLSAGADALLMRDERPT